jgi:hypothetical protein
VDFSLLKSIPIREGHNLEFRHEAFNLANHPNWNAPATGCAKRSHVRSRHLGPNNARDAVQSQASLLTAKTRETWHLRGFTPRLFM